MDKATEEWLNSYEGSTRITYKCLWQYFLEFTSLTGDQILESRRNDKEWSWEKRVMEFKNWMLKRKSENTAKTAAATVRAFFSFHRVPLQFRRRESTRLTSAKRKTEDYRFSLEDLKRMCDVASLEEKYIVLAGKSFGLRAGDFTRLSIGDLKPYLDREVPISIGEYATEKEDVSAFPFIDRDALPIVKLMIAKLERENGNAGTRMLHFKRNITITRTLKRVAERAGIDTGTKNVRFHCLRKFLIDRLSSVMSESKWKQIVGKKIHEAAYVSADSLGQDYQRAMAQTCFTTEGTSVETQKRMAYEMLKAAGLNPDALLRREKAKRPMTSEDEAKFLTEKMGKVIGKRKTEPETETNGGQVDCQRIVSEQELEEYLNDCWHVAAVLPSGKVVVER